MKFTFYGLWEDELPKLKELSETYGFVYEGTEEVLTEKNAVLSAGSDGVSILGKSRWENRSCGRFRNKGSGICPRAVSAIITSICRRRKNWVSGSAIRSIRPIRLRNSR